MPRSPSHGKALVCSLAKQAVLLFRSGMWYVDSLKYPYKRAHTLNGRCDRKGDSSRSHLSNHHFDLTGKSPGGTEHYCLTISHHLLKFRWDL